MVGTLNLGSWNGHWPMVSKAYDVFMIPPGPDPSWQATPMVFCGDSATALRQERWFFQIASPKKWACPQIGKLFTTEFCWGAQGYLMLFDAICKPVCTFTLGQPSLFAKKFNGAVN